MKKIKESEISLAKKHRFPNRKKLVNREIETVVLNTINPMNSKKLVTTFLMDFSFFTHRFFGKNLRFFFTNGHCPWGMWNNVWSPKSQRLLFERVIACFRSGHTTLMILYIYRVREWESCQTLNQIFPIARGLSKRNWLIVDMASEQWHFVSLGILVW